jgi:hypothetical protein
MPRAFGALAINALGPLAPRLPGQRNHLRIELRMAFAAFDLRDLPFTSPLDSAKRRICRCAGDVAFT